MSTSTVTQASFLSLYPGAEACIQNMHLGPNEQDTVRDCILQYSKPHTFCEALKWIVFRVTEIFQKKTCWEQTRDMIQYHAMCVAARQGLIQGYPQSPLEMQIKDRFTDFARSFANEVLDTCLLAQNRSSPVRFIETKSSNYRSILSNKYIKT